MKKRILAIVSTIAVLLTSMLASLPTSAAIVESDWIATNPNAPKDYAYSFAFVGDTQVLSMLDAGNVKDEHPADATIIYPEGDVKGSTKYMETLYGWIADNAASKKIKHVFGLGDITENLSHSPTGAQDTGNGATTLVTHQNDKEWSISAAAIKQLDGVIPYTMARGNHDVPRGFNKYFNNTGYKNMSGTTFIDSKDYNNNGVSSSSVTNLAREVVIGNDKYLIIALDYAPNDYELAWAKNIMTQSKYANHKVIVITHGYLQASGALINENDTNHKTNGDNMWNNYFSKCANLYMVVCGHVGVTDPVITYKTGDAGNVVTQVLIDPQNDDIGTEVKDKTTGQVTATVNPTGMVAIFYFSEDGKVIDIEYISTIRAAKGLSPYLKEKNQQTIDYRFDIFNKLGDYGYKYYNAEAPVFSAPTIDGDIGEGEYSTVHKKVAMGGSTVTEYLAYDASKLYFAFAYKLPDAATAPMMTFRFTASDVRDPRAISNDYSYVGTTPDKYNPKGYITVSDGRMPTGSYEVYQKIDTDDGMLYFEVAISIDAVQEVFGFKNRTIAYEFEDKTAGNVRNCVPSSELAAVLAEDFGAVTSLPQYVKYTFDAKTAFKALGHTDFYIGNAEKTAVINGEIGATEYSFTNTVKSGDTMQLSRTAVGDIDEYFAHDANKLYAGFVLHNAQYEGTTVQFLIQSLSPDTHQAVCRCMVAITLNEDGSVSVSIDKRGPANIPKDVERINADEYTIAAKVDENKNTTTYEISLTKAGLKRILGVDDLSVFGYALYIPASSGEIWRYWNYGGNSTLKAQVLGMAAQWEDRSATDNLFLPQYVRLSSKPMPEEVECYISTYDKASVRLSAKSGLRFGTEIDTEYVEYLIEAYGKENVSVGTLIVPADKLGGVEFTKEALDAAGITYLDVEATVDRPYKTDGDVTVYAGSIVKIKEKNLDRDFSGIGYIAYTKDGVTTYIYSKTYATRSVSTVAENALADLSFTKNENYKYKVELFGSGEFLYSKYSEEQRDVLYSLTISKIKDPIGSDIFSD